MPLRIHLGAAAMTLIDEYHVEIARVKFLVMVGLTVAAHELLVESEDYGVLIGDLPVVELLDDVREDLEIVGDGLVCQVVAVDKIQDLPGSFRFQEFVYRLHGDHSFPGTGCHCYKDTFLSSFHGFQYTVDSHHLVIPGGFATHLEIEWYRQWGTRLHILPIQVTLPQLLLGRETLHPEAAFLSGEVVILFETQAVAAVDERGIEVFMISLGLLETVADGMFGILGFNNGQDDATLGH